MLEANEVRGLLELQRKKEQMVADLRGEALLKGFRDATLIVSRESKLRVPVDTGGLRASITPEVRTRHNVIQGVVGSNKKHAPYMETGTRPHWPPLDAIEVWARRHGIDPFVVARAIARKGTKGRKYLQGAFEKHAERIQRMIGDAVGRIVSK